MQEGNKCSLRYVSVLLFILNWMWNERERKIVEAICDGFLHDDYVWKGKVFEGKILYKNRLLRETMEVE